MGTRRDRLKEIVASGVAAVGYELVGVELQGAGRGQVLRVYIDHPDGITVDDCAMVSHQLSGLLDVEDPIPGDYQLEVSSPGIERPLFEAAHYERFAGSRARLRLREPMGGRRKLTGTIRGCSEGVVRLEEDGETWEVPLEAISRANLVADV